MQPLKEPTRAYFDRFSSPSDSCSTRTHSASCNYQDQELHQPKCTLTTTIASTPNSMPKRPHLRTLQVRQRVFAFPGKLRSRSVVSARARVGTFEFFKPFSPWVKPSRLVIGVLRHKNSSTGWKKVILLVYLTKYLQLPGPGTFSASGWGGEILLLIEYPIFATLFIG